MTKKTYFYSNLFAWGFVLFLIGSYAFGWTTPSENPPGGNITLSSSQWTTSGSDIYYNTGNVGIGTTSPGAKLDVNGNAIIGAGPNVGTTIPLRIDGLAVSDGANPYGNYAGILFDANTAYTSFARRYLITNALGVNKFGIIRSTDALTDPALGTAGVITSGTADFVIDYTGNVGIGTTEPGAKLDVSGDIRATGSVLWGNSASRTQTKDDAGAIASKSGFFEASAPTNYYSGASSWQHLIEARHSNDGNNYALQIAGSFFDQDLYFRKTNNSATQAWAKLVNVNSAGNVLFPGSGIWNSSGNVGIGTTAPGYMLDVSGTGRFTGNLTGIGFFYSSDEKLKKNIQDIETPLAKIMKLDGISFDWKESDKKSMGLIAQDVEKVFPEIVNTDEETGLKSIEYAKLVAPLIEAVKEQQKMIDEQRELINQQGEEIKALKVSFGQL